MTSSYPDLIQSLPDADIPFEGMRGKLLQAGGHQVVFMTIDPVGAAPPHSHGAQWGVVLEGEMELTIGGSTRLIAKGDSYYIPAGVVHSAVIRAPTRIVDLFAEPSRYEPKQRWVAPSFGELRVPILGHSARPDMW